MILELNNYWRNAKQCQYYAIVLTNIVLESMIRAGRACALPGPCLEHLQRPGEYARSSHALHDPTIARSGAASLHNAVCLARSRCMMKTTQDWAGSSPSIRLINTTTDNVPFVA